MDLDAEVAVLEKSRRTLTRWGIWGTALYLGALLGYGVFAGRDFTALSPNEVGDFLAGAFAPLAFLWLVIGYRMQALELEQNSKALRQQAEEMRSAVEQASEQTKALKASERLARQALMEEKCQKFEEELCRSAAEFWMIVQSTDCYPLWEGFSRGDKEIFCRFIDERWESSACLSAVKKQQDNLQRAGRKFISTYSHLLILLQSMEGATDTEHYETSVFGAVNSRLTNFLPKG